MRNILIYFYLKYDGDNVKIYEAICCNREKPENHELEAALKGVKLNNYITIIDDDYPEELKTFENIPPIVINRLSTLSKYSLTTLTRRIASYIYSTAVLSSTSGNYNIYFDEIERTFDLDFKLADNKYLLEMISDELFEYQGLEGNADNVIVEEDCFNVNLWTDYISGLNLECDEED